MSIIVKISFLFIFGSVFGWILELFYRKWFGAHNDDHHWINPGFLVGPWLPIYGFGLTSLYVMGQFPVRENVDGIGFKLLVFGLMAIAMTVIELIAGLIFIKGLKVRLWDYTKERFNYKGIICPKFSLFWAGLGAIYYFLIHPHILKILQWLGANMAFCLVIGFFYGVFFMDLVYSFSLASKLRSFANEYKIVLKYEELKSHIRQMARARKAKVRFLFALGNRKNILATLTEYVMRLECGIGEKVSEFKEEIKNNN